MKKISSCLFAVILCLVLLITSIPFVTATSKPKAPKKISISGIYYYSKTISVNIDIVKDQRVKGYELSAKAQGDKTIKVNAPQYYNLKTTFADLKNISHNKFYKIRARSYIKKGNKKIYSKYSKAIYACHSVAVKSFSAADYTLRWNKVAGAQKYDVQASFNSRSGFKTIKSNIKATNCKITKINNKKIKKGSSFYVKIIAKKKANGKVYYSDKNSSSYCYISNYA